MNTHDHHDDDSLPGEDELKALYRRLPSKEPSPALDRAVRQVAAGATHPSPRLPRWLAALASAAVLVLAAGIGWRLHEQPPGNTSSPIPPERATADSARMAAPSKPTTEAAGAAASLPPSRIVAAPPQPHTAIRSALKPRLLPATSVAPPSAPGRDTQDLAAAAPVTPPPAHASAVSAKTARGDEDEGQAPVTQGMRPALAAPPADRTAADPADSPAQELDKIRLLLAQQRRGEAMLRLATFRRTHPGVAVPDDLKDLQATHE